MNAKSTTNFRNGCNNSQACLQKNLCEVVACRKNSWIIKKNPANLFWHTELSAMGSRTRNWTWGSQCQVCWPKTHSLRSHLLWSRWRVDNNVRGGWVAEAPNNMWCCGHRLGSTPSADEGGVYIWQVMLVVGSFSGALDKLWCSYVFMAIGLVGFPSVSFPTYGRYGVFQARSPFDGGYLRPLI
jgi:hypothetical protein